MIRSSSLFISFLLFAGASTLLEGTPTLNGNNVVISYLEPDMSTVVASQTVTVGPGPEVTCPGSRAGGGICGALVEASTIDIGSSFITFNEASGGRYNATTFNGMLFSGLNFGPGYYLSDFELSTNLPGLTPSDISFTPTSIEFNASGLSFYSSPYFIILDLTSVPEPETYGLFGVAIVGFGCLQLSRRRESQWWRHGIQT